MKLTKGEFSLLSFSGQKKLLMEKGINLISIKLSGNWTVKLFLLYDFFVEIYFENESDEIKKINLAIINPPSIYFD